MSFSKPSDCHHQEREAHLCHFNQCPDCRQPCNLPLQGCAHRCSAVCHDSVLVKEETNASNTPWGAKEKVARKPLPCPSCPVPTAVGCFGRHTVRSACCEPSYRVFSFSVSNIAMRLRQTILLWSSVPTYSQMSESSVSSALPSCVRRSQ